MFFNISPQDMPVDINKVIYYVEYLQTLNPETKLLMPSGVITTVAALENFIYSYLEMPGNDDITGETLLRVVEDIIGANAPMAASIYDNTWTTTIGTLASDGYRLYAYGTHELPVLPFASKSRFQKNDINVESTSLPFNNVGNSMFVLNGLIHIPEKITDYHVVLRNAFYEGVNPEFSTDSVTVIQISNTVNTVTDSGYYTWQEQEPIHYVVKTASLEIQSITGTNNKNIVVSVDPQDYDRKIILAGLLMGGNNSLPPVGPDSFAFDPVNDIDMRFVVAGLLNRQELPITPIGEQDGIPVYSYDDIIGDEFVNWLLNHPMSYTLFSKNTPAGQLRFGKEHVTNKAGCFITSHLPLAVPGVGVLLESDTGGFIQPHRELYTQYYIEYQGGNRELFPGDGAVPDGVDVLFI